VNAPPADAITSENNILTTLTPIAPPRRTTTTSPPPAAATSDVISPPQSPTDAPSSFITVTTSRDGATATVSIPASQTIGDQQKQQPSNNNGQEATPPPSVGQENGNNEPADNLIVESGNDNSKVIGTAVGISGKFAQEYSKYHCMLDGSLTLPLMETPPYLIF
jgi:hypothetical protein